jgi:hypothetical protein
MPDEGAVERNVKQAQIALERASQRNGGQHIYPTPPASVTGVQSGGLSRAVGGERNPVGGEK